MSTSLYYKEGSILALKVSDNFSAYMRYGSSATAMPPILTAMILLK